MQKQIWDPAVSIKSDIKEIYKNSATLLPKYFCFRKYSYFSQEYLIYINIMIGLLFFSEFNTYF